MPSSSSSPSVTSVRLLLALSMSRRLASPDDPIDCISSQDPMKLSTIAAMTELETTKDSNELGEQDNGAGSGVLGSQA
ncbi:hypothetical protein L2E82_17448 [Cichorium intybus]|uniref:Uncharacterized protein n=1 Tax=Cichorium intybus TaxID=13427 RepID=A0ACB9F8Y7_CICIN|nr:hypothetical protein L2E82_17448 [Cichorium intybus]